MLFVERQRRACCIPRTQPATISKITFQISLSIQIKITVRYELFAVPQFN